MAKDGKRKKDRSKYIVFAVFTIIGGVFGFSYGMKIAENIEGRNVLEIVMLLSVMLVSLYAAIYTQIAAHEAGHWLFGRLTGYKFISYRIAKLMLVKEDGRFRFKKFTIVGAGGQCLMLPPGDSGNYPYALYNMGGVIVNALVSAVCLILIIALPEIPFLSPFLNINCLIGLAFALLNGIPARIGGITNDGFNILALRRDAGARRAFWIQLRVAALLSTGIRMRDMSAEWFDLPKDSDLNNPLICALAIMRCSYLRDLYQFDKAREESRYLTENVKGLIDLHKNELTCELMFDEIMNECRKEEIERLYTVQLKQYIKATETYLSRRRLMYAYQLIAMKNGAEAEKQLAAFEKLTKTYPYKAEIEAEMELIAIIQKKATE